MNNIFVVGTEYQLLQAQCLIMHLPKTNGLNHLGFIGTRKINLNLIDKTYFTGIIFFPSIYPEGSPKKLTKKYIDKLENLYFEILQNHHLVNLSPITLSPITLYGAHDETTEFAVLKKLIAPSYYVSIEDGLANYYTRRSIDKIKIIIKNLVFNYVFNKSIELFFNYGEGNSDVSYRLFPELTSNKGDHIDLKPILRNCLREYCEKIKINFSSSDYILLSQYCEIQVIPYSSKIKNYIEYLEKKNTIIIPHPSQRELITNQISDDRIYTKSLPIELLLYLNNNIKNIHFYSPSTSILTVLALFDDINVYYHGKIGLRYRSLFFKCKKIFPKKFFIQK